jgi:ferredoxin
MRSVRNIIGIDEEKCNGCGQCATACAEGAIAMVEGKAKLVSEVYCDGLGACIGECPTGALTIEQRQAQEFDPAATEQHLARRFGKLSVAPPGHTRAAPSEVEGRQGRAPVAAGMPLPQGGRAGGLVCPGSAPRSLRETARGVHEPRAQDATETPSRLGNWPVQIMLVPPAAPYLKAARLVIAADCTAFAYADFHRRFLGSNVLLVGCPKLDDAAFYRDKLAQLIAANDIQHIEVVYMEVPCCSGLVRVVREAIAQTGRETPLTLTKIGIRGEVKESAPARAG